MPVFHSLTATTPDNTSYEIRPSHWNDPHVIVLSGSEVIKWASAGTNSISSGTLVFSNSNNVTFGMDPSGIVTASASMAAGVGDGYNILAAGTQTAGTANTVVFNNSNGITFGMSNSSVITASHNGLTTAMASNRGSDFVQATAAFAGTSASGTIGSNGISVSIGPYITTAMLSNAATISNIKVSAGTLSSNRSDITFGNSNGITFGLETNGVVTGTVATNYAVSNHSHGNPTLALTNLSGTTASNSAGLTLSLSAAAPGAGGGIAAAAGTQTQTSGTVLFQNSNGITFGMSNSSVVTASHNGLTTAALSDHSHGNPTLALTNISGTTASASNGMTLSLSAAAPGGGAAVTHSTYIPYYPQSSQTQTMGAKGVTTASAFVFPISIVGNVAFNRIEMLMSNSWATSTVSGRMTIWSEFGLYSNNAMTLSRISSGSFSFIATNSSVSATLSWPTAVSTTGYGYGSLGMTTTAQIQSLVGSAGIRLVGLQFGGNMTLTEGLYWLGLHQRQSTSSANIGMSSALVGAPMFNMINNAPFGSSTAAMATNASYNFGWGVFTSTGSAGHSGTNLPSAMAMSAISQSVSILPLITFISR